MCIKLRRPLRGGHVYDPPAGGPCSATAQPGHFNPACCIKQPAGRGRYFWRCTHEDPERCSYQNQYIRRSKRCGVLKVREYQIYTWFRYTLSNIRAHFEQLVLQEYHTNKLLRRVPSRCSKRPGVPVVYLISYWYIKYSMRSKTDFFASSTCDAYCNTLMRIAIRGLNLCWVFGKKRSALESAKCVFECT